VRTLTSKQRLLRAIRHQEPDLVPVSPRTWTFLIDYYGHNGWQYELKGAAEFDYDPFFYFHAPLPNYVADQRASYEDLPDVSVELDIEHLPDATRVRRRIQTPAGPLTDSMIHYKPGGIYGVSPNPRWEERLLKDEADLERLTFLLPKPTKAAFEPLVAMGEIIGERGLVHVGMDTALTHQAGWAMELVDLMVACYERPDFVRSLLSLYHRHTMAIERCALEAGAEAIYTTDYFSSLSAGWSPQLYREFLLPLIREQAALAHEYGAIFHHYDDGKIMAVLPMLADAGVDVISTVPAPPLGDMDLKQAKALVGDRICFNGYVDAINVVKNGTIEQIRETVRQAIVDGAPGGGFIIGSSDGIRDAPKENVRAYFDACREFGDYDHLGRAG